MSFTSGYKVNANTEYEFTVSNETLNEIVQSDSGITEGDISPYCYTALIDSRIKSVFIQSRKNVMATGFDGWQSENMPYYFIRDTRYIHSNDDINKNDTVYERNFLTWNGTIYPNTPQEKQGTFLITDIKDIKRWFVDFNAGMFITDNFESVITENGVTTPFTGYTGTGYTYLSSTVNVPVIHSDNNNPLLNPDENIHIVNVLVINNELWIGQLNPSCHGQADTGAFQSTYAQYVYSYVKGYLNTSSTPPVIYQRGSDSWAGIAEIKEMDFPDLDNRTTVYRSYVETSNGVILEINGNSGGTFDVLTVSGTHCKDLDTLLTWQSWCGLKFTYNNVMYKPIIQNGVIVGYTDDMTAPSEYDDMTNVTGNNISPIPPTPSAPTGDKEIDMPLAYIGGTAGMVDFIKINAAGLASADDIADAVSRFDITTIGKDLLRNFVAFKCYAVLNIDDSVVRDIKVAGHILKDENDHALQGEYIGAIAPVDFSAGRIEPMYNDYRDYAPYTRIQMYVPFCGWFDLPSWCMGKEITGTMFTDLYNGTVKAVIYASRTVVAEVGGCCAFDIPFAAESTGMKAGAVISSALNTAAMAGATIAAPNIATGIAAVSSAANFISAANSNGTTLKGVMGDGSNTNGLLHVYIKTTRPNAPNDKKTIPDKYKHEYGIPCYKELTLTAGDGYTQIMDANIEGAMTDREKQLIIDGFRHGLIL